MKAKYKVGKTLKPWGGEDTQTITFIVTEDCNLRCKYCYITHKKSNKRMEFSTAKKFIDFLFQENIERKSGVILDFIGGEPLLEIELIDKICDYFKVKAFLKNDDWFWNYRISMGTNGVTYSDDKVQRFIRKNEGKTSIGITLDGTKEKHDLQRVFPDGSGSYDKIMQSIPLWLSQHNQHTKVTFASDDLIFLKESIIALWDMGIVDVAANVVFEDVWKDGDDELFESQLISLADYIIDNKLYDKYTCTLFDDSIGGYYNRADLSITYCGAGKMLAMDTSGNFFPCLRYKDYSLNNQEEWKIGSVSSGINMEKLRPFVLAMNEYQSNTRCKECEIATGCAFCQGFNYDDSPNGTNFHRATYICKMHKARVRANDYYFSRLLNEYGLTRDDNAKRKKKLYFLLSDNFVTYCDYKNDISADNSMSKESILKGLIFARKNFFEPVFVHSKSKYISGLSEILENYTVSHIMPINHYQMANKDTLHITKYVFTAADLNDEKYNITETLSNCILTVDENEINGLGALVEKLIKKTDRIELHINNISSSFNEHVYEIQLSNIKDLLLKREYSTKEINVLTDYLKLNEHNSCSAGDKSFVFGSNERIYICPGIYTTQKENSIASISCTTKPHV